MGFYVMGAHTSLSWHSTREEAERERDRLLMWGAWSGIPPRVEPDRDEPDEAPEWARRDG